MNTKRILLTGMVLVLAGACAWAASEISGFTAVSDSEAAQIVGGDGPGYECDYNHSITGAPEIWPCSNNGNNTACLYGAWCQKSARYGCVWTGSGECYEYPMVYVESGGCIWHPESTACLPDGSYYQPETIDACG